ncbi:TPA: glycine-rich protein [Clostridioides difficile]|uniref:glycine rich domain-containing protein n=6 Tax=Clostridioides difficile TaxID=1496 RepID=UPI00097FFD9E|nr:glycine rich domain-containing protein [Clostridioides difficile]MDV9771607.1 glycine-rich protein [Clostridioides difficile]MDW0085072.1 glycine-rich protein [Clostridioides difficile]MDY6638605.1 glycine-rich protein [Clostridioides difficile]SJP74185.1 Glycine rich protein [Clostridioides difficile]
MQTEWNFGYNGSPQSVILKPGKYKFECWGSSGGINNSSWYTDAKGGYSKGEITLKKQTTLYIYVGESGYASSSTANNTKSGFNGGGKGYLNQQVMGTYYSMYGGGATDIRLVGGAWDDEQGLLSRIIVAGGGGGSYHPYTGGAGGGLEGGTGYSSNDRYRPGGTQYQGGIGRVNTENGSFGKGCSVKDSTGEGGGGGWFGGAGMNGVGAGGGGSGYVLTKDSYKPTGYTPTSEYYFDNVVMESGGNTAGAYGYAKITLLQALPFLTVSSYNSITATFKADHTDPALLTKIEVFIDDVLKETITTDLTLEKTINYTLEDNALHTLKIVVTDSNNATAEKVLSISKNIMPLPEDVNLNDISTKLTEVNAGFRTGKTSIINTLALKNIEASLNNTLVELSEKIKTSFDSSDASVQELQNRITELTNQLSQRKRWASGTYTFTQSDVADFVAKVGKLSYLTVQTNLNFTPKIIVVRGIKLKKTASVFLDFSDITNFGDFGTTGHYYFNGRHYYDFCIKFENFSSNSFQLRLYSMEGLEGDGITSVCVLGDTFTWYAYE